MFLAFPPILGGTGPTAYLILGLIIVLVIAVGLFVYRFLKEDID
ncbi:MAG: LPXTG cell wall anchor domain-containing protein [Bacteroidota bacterium]